jgi:8-oxo-dGTP pyrophosphatase MutT (NUDIX family)
MNPPLLVLLDQYQPQNPHEIEMAARLRAFLEQAEGATAFGREMAGPPEIQGHVTGSAWVVNPELDRVVLVHHAKLGKWVQPGGHCDDEADVLNVALREAREETGLEVSPLQTGIFDVDIHLIPEYWNTPEHYHYDVRFLLQADHGAVPVVSHESHAVRWVALDEVLELSDEESVRRMVEKTRRLAG